MARKRYAAEAIIGTLREAEVVLAQGEAVAQVARRLGVGRANGVPLAAGSTGGCGSTRPSG